MPLGIIPGCGLRGLASSVQGYKPPFEEKKIAIQPQIWKLAAPTVYYEIPTFTQSKLSAKIVFLLAFQHIFFYCSFF